MTDEEITGALRRSIRERARMIADARYLIGRLNVKWLKDRNLDEMTDETLRALTEEMWYGARNRAAREVD